MCSYRGIKGASVLSEFVKIPEQVLLDKMPTTSRSAKYDLNNLWPNPNFSLKPWYIGSLTFDKRLRSIKYPLEFYRTTK